MRRIWLFSAHKIKSSESVKVLFIFRCSKNWQKKSAAKDEKYFSFKVAQSLQFLGYLRTVSLKFQKATSKIEFLRQFSKALRKLDHVLLWILSSEHQYWAVTVQYLCRVKKISMTKVLFIFRCTLFLPIFTVAKDEKYFRAEILEKISLVFGPTDDTKRTFWN